MALRLATFVLCTFSFAISAVIQVDPHCLITSSDAGRYANCSYRDLKEFPENVDTYVTVSIYVPSFCYIF